MPSADTVGLITPHGDRKPLKHQQHAEETGDLITPHGDRKPPSRPAQPRLFPASHCPSWGSKTRSVLRRRRRRARLITPHGDRKPATASVGAAPSVTHYPSWGSKTRRYRWREDDDAAPHYPSWGSKTRRTGRYPTQSRTLITPHGDRKPEGRPFCCANSGPHYPSWGSKTILYSSGAHIEYPSHYPSWGSKTLHLSAL